MCVCVCVLGQKPVGGRELATERVEACVTEMRSWMRKNKLQLNDSKTDNIWNRGQITKVQSRNTDTFKLALSKLASLSQTPASGLPIKLPCDVFRLFGKIIL